MINYSFWIIIWLIWYNSITCLPPLSSSLSDGLDWLICRCCRCRWAREKRCQKTLANQLECDLMLIDWLSHAAAIAICPSMKFKLLAFLLSCLFHKKSIADNDVAQINQRFVGWLLTEATCCLALSKLEFSQASATSSRPISHSLHSPSPLMECWWWWWSRRSKSAWRYFHLNITRLTNAANTAQWRHFPIKTDSLLIGSQLALCLNRDELNECGRRYGGDTYC